MNMRLMAWYQHIACFCLCILSIGQLAVTDNPETTQSPNNVDCNFDESTCGWTQAQEDDFDWMRQRGQANFVGSGPLHDHTKDGYYMYIDARNYGRDQKARLVSPIIDIMSGMSKCFQFYYIMYGSEVGTLNVFKIGNGSMSPAIWARKGTQGLTWTMGQLTLNVSGQVVLEGNGASSNYGDIAIDDVRVIDGPCSSTAPKGSAASMACDFEVDLCGYEDVQSAYSESWHRTIGALTQTQTNVSAYDHTTQQPTGSCMTLYGTAENAQRTISLRSSEINETGEYCVTFFYRKTSNDVGPFSMSLWDNMEKENMFTSWEEEGSVPGFEWNKVQALVFLSKSSKLSFDVARGRSPGDISIDDISVNSGPCERPPKCDFENGTLCSWFNDHIHDDYDWQIITDAKDVQFFGPLYDADSNEDGGFIQLEMARNPSSQEAYFVSEELKLSDATCFQFYYFSKTEGPEYDKIPMVLTLYLRNSNNTDFPGTPIWQLAMTTGDSVFHYGTVSLPLNQDFRLIFGGSVTQGQVIALDKISTDMGSCDYGPLEAKPTSTTSAPTAAATSTSPFSPPSLSSGPSSPWDCNFDVDMCQWKLADHNASTEGWKLQKASESACGLQLEPASTPDDGDYLVSCGTQSKLECEMQFQGNSLYCMSFWYIMYSTTTQEFTVQLVEGSDVQKQVYKQDSEGNGWHQLEFEILPPESDYTVQFVSDQSAVGPNMIAIDNIRVTQGHCKENAGPNCTFEQGYCGWHNSVDIDMEFIVTSGQSSFLGFVNVDHTLGTSRGNFVKAVSDSEYPGEKARIDSASLTFDYPVCLRFYYYMMQSGNSNLTVNTQNSQDHHPIPLWDESNTQKEGSWQMGEVTVYYLRDTKVSFIFTAGSSGECSIDDITFTEGECPFSGETDFENGFDVFHNMYSNDFNWMIASPSEGTYPWLPANDFSMNSPKGHFAVAEYNVSGSAGRKAELWSSVSPAADSMCTTFSLFVHGKDPGTLNVTFVNYQETSREVVWSLTPSAEMIDNVIYAAYPHVYPDKFFVVFTAILGSDGGWAIDDILTVPVADPMCAVQPPEAAASAVVPPSPPTTASTPQFTQVYDNDCTFDYTCSWVSDKQSNLKWVLSVGNESYPFVPTTGRPGAYDLWFLTLPFHEPGETAYLRSPLFDNGKIYDLRFWLNMNGPKPGQFSVNVSSSDNMPSTLIYYRNVVTDGWEEVDLRLSYDFAFNVTFAGTRGSEDQDSMSIDDIEVVYAVQSQIDKIDDTVTKCTFEKDDLCGFVQDEKDNMEWAWQGGDDGILIQDHTTMSSAGHAIVVSSSKGGAGDVARLTSDSILPMSGCLTFWLLMPSDGAALRVYLLSRQREDLLVQRQNSQGSYWEKMEVTATSNYPFRISLVAELLDNSQTTDVVIDDFALTEGACATYGACAFERDLCTWQNVMSDVGGDDFDWMRGSGNTSDETGPRIDSTVGLPVGHYMYIESGSQHYGDRAWLESETFSPGMQCLHFHYHMQGASIGSLNVYTVPVGSSNLTWVWSLSGDQGSNWNSALVTVGTDLHNYQVRFEATLGYSVTSDIAIDDILFMPGSCDILPAKADASLIAPSTSPGPSTRQQVTSPATEMSCDFESMDICNFMNEDSEDVDHYDWMWSEFGTPTVDPVDPYHDHTFNNGSQGHFLYTQHGPSTDEYITARIISPAYISETGEPQCLEFFYFMSGEDDIGQLHLFIAPDGQEKNLVYGMLEWSQDYDSGPGWKRALVPILRIGGYRVVFESVMRTDDCYHGLDDVTIYNRECKPTDECDFEDGVCLWSNTGAEDNEGLQWTRYQGRERTANFAPAVDHTTNTVDGSYMMVESSLQNSKLNAWLYSQIILEAQVEHTVEGAFGIDDTEILAADCSTEPVAARTITNPFLIPNCGFDHQGDKCGWKLPGDKHKKFQMKADVEGWFGDHSPSGDGLFIGVDSGKTETNTTVIALSKLLPPTGGVRCFSFWFRLFKDGGASLELDIVNAGANVTLWKAVPDNTDDWMPAAVNIYSDLDYTLMFIGIVGEKVVGSIGFDDIKLLHGACPRSEVIDFENGLMDFLTPADDKDDQWQVVGASTSLVRADHTYDTSEGHVLQADLGAPNQELIASVRTPRYPPVTMECMEFWYFKAGSNSSWLMVTLVSKSSPSASFYNYYEQWVTTTNSSQWTKVYVDIDFPSPYWIEFEAGTFNTSVHQMVAIDDIRFLPTGCPTGAACDFEYDECKYTSSEDGLVKWQLGKGLYDNSLMAVDHTTKNSQGSYMEVTIPDDADRNYTVDLTSQELGPELGKKCISFWYYGLGEGILEVSMKTTSQSVTTFMSKKLENNQNVDRNFRNWQNMRVDLNKTGLPNYIVFTYKSSTAKSSLAIDDIVTVETSCSSMDEGTSNENNGENKPDVSQIMYKCDFEALDLCNYSTGMSTANWTMFSIDSEHEANTGIDYDHTKNNRYGHYIYLDTTGKKANTSAQLFMPPIVDEVNTCLSFYYVMNGEDVNRLNVYLIHERTRKLHWTTSGDQGKDWHHCYVDIMTHPYPVQLMIEAVAGGGDIGDIGLDDVWLYSGICLGEEECTFEDNKYCSMDQDNLDEVDWVIWSGVSGNDTYTDPQVDHTYQTDEGYYLRMDLNATNIGDKARIFTKLYTAESAQCLEFWYHIKNPTNGTNVLAILLRDERGVEKNIGTYEGFFDDMWNRALHPINLEDWNKYQIVFEGQSGGPEGDIALDDIKVSGDACDILITCGFDSQNLDLCGWEHMTDSFPPWEVLPSHHYMMVNFTSAHQVTKVASETIPITALDYLCMGMSYMMQGENVGFLNISIEFQYPELEIIPAFSDYGNKGKVWSKAFIEKPQTTLGYFRFVITGTSADSFDSTKEGVIKVTDIFFAYDDLTCQYHHPGNNLLYACNMEGGLFPRTMICDFIKNCEYGDDEATCGQCNFNDNDDCIWENTATGPGPLMFARIETVPDGMAKDDHDGGFLGLQMEIGDSNDRDYADLTLKQEIGPSPSGCRLTFRYYMPVLDRADIGSLYVVLEENYEETELWHSAPQKLFTWYQASVDIGGIHSRFKLHIRASQIPFQYAMGIDDLGYSGCSFPEPVDGPCKQDQFKCNNKACIDNNKLCDFTDECGDGSDEDPALCAGYIMDNFEDSFGYWSQDTSDKFDWTRHSGMWISTTSGPRRDHTLGTHFGNYIIMDPTGQADGFTARLISPQFVATQDGQCSMRFYYHMYGASDGLLTLFIKSNTTGNEAINDEYRATMEDFWELSDRVLTSNDTFQVILEGKVEGQYSTEIGIDDITFTPGCQLVHPPSVKTTLASTSTKITTTVKSTMATSTKIASTNAPGKSSPTPVATPKSQTSKVITSHTPVGRHSTVPGKHTGVPSRKTIAVSTSTTVTNTAKGHVKRPDTSSGGSDSWKIAVGVVLGLVGLIAVIAGTLFYLKRTQRLAGFSFSRFGRRGSTETGVSNPIFGRSERKTSIQMEDITPKS